MIVGDLGNKKEPSTNIVYTVSLQTAMPTYIVAMTNQCVKRF